MNSRFLHGILFTLAATTVVCGQSVWLPSHGQFIATPGFSFSTFDEYWAGRNTVSTLKNNNESFDQYTGFLALEYGILSNLAADATVGYTATSSTRTFGNEADEGWADTMLGLRYRLMEEAEVLPAVGLRFGGIIAGTYDENTPFSAGDGAHGLEWSLQLGKNFGHTGFGIYGDFGYRLRENPVPDELFGSVGVFKQFRGIFAATDAITGNVGYRHVQSLSGLDIGGNGFAPGQGPSHGFPALREINQVFEWAVGYMDVGQRQYQFTMGKSIDGRNTGDKLAFLLTISLPFGGN